MIKVSKWVGGTFQFDELSVSVAAPFQMPSSQVLFLVDMDLCLPLVRLNNPKDLSSEATGTTATASASSSQLLAMLSELKRTMLRMLCAQSSVAAADAASAELVQFSFRFYSSTGYFVAQNGNRSAVKASEFKVIYNRLF